MSLREQAKAYEPAAKTQNIAELNVVDIDDVTLFDGSGKTTNEHGQEEEFAYKYIVVDSVQYRVPKPVLGQLKTHLESNPLLKTFKVAKAGSGMSTQYTVVPLSYKEGAVAEEVKEQ